MDKRILEVFMRALLMTHQVRISLYINP